MNSENKTSGGHLLALFTIVVWGTTYVSTKVLLVHFQPVEILLMRFVMGFLGLLLIYPRPMKVERGHEKYFIMAGLTGITCYYLLDNISLVYTQATNVGVIISVAPFFTAIFSHIFLKTKKLGKYFIIGFLLAMVGIFLVSFNGSTNFQLNPLGDLLALLAAVVWAVYSIVSRKIGDLGYPTIPATRRMFLYGMVFMIPAVINMGYHPDYSKLTDPVILANLLFLGVCASALCFVTWNMAVKFLGAVKTSLYIYLTPVITLVTSMIVLGERVNLMSGIGIACTLAGLLLSQKQD
ncbi:MAG: DMT family transporter [Lachnospiraceae bacterium]|nr:DMT family transporter [Lachnospiraceae bacterium]